MEKNNGKAIAIAALIVASIALSVGFAAFTDALNISGTANVAQGTNTFEGSFGYADDAACEYTTGADKTIPNATYSAGSATGNTWSGIQVPLSADHPSVTCTATIENSSAYDAALTSIVASGAPTCSSSTATNTTAVCNTVTETVQIGSSSNQGVANKDTTTNQTISSTPNLRIGKLDGSTPGSTTVTVIIAYDSTVVPDGDITVTLPTITHNYTTVADQ